MSPKPFFRAVLLLGVPVAMLIARGDWLLLSVRSCVWQRTYMYSTCEAEGKGGVLYRQALPHNQAAIRGYPCSHLCTCRLEK